MHTFCLINVHNVHTSVNQVINENWFVTQLREVTKDATIDKTTTQTTLTFSITVSVFEVNCHS
eukprot:SAG31_NODE_754_length_12324_cov_3.930061_3_plen_63_part_00